MKVNFSSRKIQYILSFCLLIILVIIGNIRASKGISFTDEAYYIATPYHLAHNGTFFVDEFINATHQFDIVISPVFKLFPTITLFQYRMLGIFFYLLSLVSLFIYLTRRGPILIVALGCAIAFLFNNFGGISSPSYNLLSSSFSLYGLVCLLWSYELKKKILQAIIAIGSGLLFVLMITSYLPMVLLMMVPIGFLIFTLHNQKKFRNYLVPTMIMLTTILIVLTIIAIGLYLSGRLPIYIENLQDISSTMALADQGIVKKMRNLFDALKSLYKSLILLSIGFYIILTFLQKIVVNKKIARFSFLIEAGSFLLLFYGSSVFSPIDLTFIPLVFLFSAIALFILFHSKLSTNNMFAFLIIWGIVHSALYLIFSSNVLVSAKLGFMVLLTVVPVVFSLYFEHLHKTKKQLFFTAIYILLLIFTTVGIMYYFDLLYGERKPYNLTYPFTNSKLAGIYSTPEKVIPLEKLLHYLKDKVKPGDNLLAYNDMPLLYYLTDTIPTYNTVWSIDNYWPYSLKKKLTEKMIKSGKTSEYVVRLVASPDALEYMPIAPNVFDYRMPLDEYVKKHFYLEAVIFPYEIWKRADEPGDYFFNKQKPIYEEAYSESSPLRLEPFTTDIRALAFLPTDTFVFDSKMSKDNVLRITATKSTESNNRSVRFGYFSSVPELSTYLHKGNQVIFMVKVRVTGMKNDNSAYPAVMYIKSKFNENRVSIYKREWELYEVAKYIEEEGERFDIGIIWQPYFQNDTIEIKDMKIFVQ